MEEDGTKPELYSVTPIEGRGRGCVTCTKIPAGTTLVEESPLVAVVLKDRFESTCHGCFEQQKQQQQSSSSNLFKCSRCKSVRYCSKECQKHDWLVGHKYECALGGTEIQRMQSVVRLAIRVFARSKMKGENALSEDQRRQLSTLDYQDKFNMNHMMRMATLSASLHQTLDKLKLPNSFTTTTTTDRATVIKNLSTFLQQLECNSHGIRNEKMQVAAMGLYLAGSMFNHSCVPNCSWSFYKGKLSVTNLSAREPNEELLISYCDHTFDRSSRIHFLQERYSFLCNCERCSLPMEEYSSNVLDTCLVAVKCPNCSSSSSNATSPKNGYIIPHEAIIHATTTTNNNDAKKSSSMECQTCHQSCSSTQISNIVKNATTAYEECYKQVISGKIQASQAIQMFQKLLSTYTNQLHPHHSLLHRIRTYLIEATLNFYQQPLLSSSLSSSTSSNTHVLPDWFYQYSEECWLWLMKVLPMGDPNIIAVLYHHYESVWYHLRTHTTTTNSSIQKRKKFLEFTLLKNVQLGYPKNGPFRTKVESMVASSGN